MQENRETESNRYFPIIGRLPPFKNLLGGSTTEYERTEIIIFIRPTVLTDPNEAGQLSHDTVETIEETEAVQDYLKTNTTGDIYLEGSRFEENKSLIPLRLPEIQALSSRLFKL